MLLLEVYSLQNRYFVKGKKPNRVMSHQRVGQIKGEILKKRDEMKNGC